VPLRLKQFSGGDSSLEKATVAKAIVFRGTPPDLLGRTTTYKLFFDRGDDGVYHLEKWESEQFDPDPKEIKWLQTMKKWLGR
jgi:hypothetical protein